MCVSLRVSLCVCVSLCAYACVCVFVCTSEGVCGGNNQIKSDTRGEQSIFRSILVFTLTSFKNKQRYQKVYQRWGGGGPSTILIHHSCRIYNINLSPAPESALRETSEQSLVREQISPRGKASLFVKHISDTKANQCALQRH